ncbi:MAG: glycosyltransferase family 4 protein [Limnochordia bacterium]
MRVLLTSILCRSGLMTHVNDLARYLAGRGIFAAIAFKRVNYLSDEGKQSILARLGEIPRLIYDSTEELERFIAEIKCTLIHAHSHATFQSAAEASVRMGIPLVVTLHSVYPWHRRFRAVLALANRIIAVGPAQAREARGFLGKTEVIQNGIDTQYFVPGQGGEPGSGQINVLWYGRVDGKLARGLGVLDQIAPLLPEDIKLVALGSARPQPKNIPLLPWTDDPRPFLQQSQITFGHSRSLREAMASGSIGILLGHGYGGMVTEERLIKENLVLDAFPEYRLAKPRPAVILQDLLTLAQRPDLAELRQGVRAVAEKYFALEEMGEKVVEAYLAALDHTGHA